MNEINKKFDGVLWEWKGRRVIRELKPICPKCQYELDIKITGFGITTNLPDITISQGHVSYSCPKCSFSTKTNIDSVNNPEDLRKAVLKEFEHRLRLKSSENTKN
jgi:hypothetical protein